MKRSGKLKIGWTLPILVVLVGCGGAGDRLLPATRGYLLVSIDTLRADHLGCYGYHRETSPFLDSLAARGVLFENAFVQLPGTLPSHMSIFTGLYPVEHGVYPPDGVLSPEIETLPEAFQRSGFRTAGHTEGGYVHGGYGFARGFDEFSHEALKIETDVERTFTRGLEFLRGLEGEDSFFLFLHTYVVHDPYFPTDEYLQRFWPGPAPETFAATGPNFSAFNRGDLTMSQEALEYYRAAYDASIRYLDDVLRSFVGELSRLGLDGQVTLILTSDHGEEFLEHGQMAHAQVYRETLHVPLIVVHPGVEARRVGTVVRSVDIAPTLYELAGIEARSPISGRSSVPLLAGAEMPLEDAYAESFDRHRRSLIRWHRGTLYHLLSEWPDGWARLFDLTADPSATRDLSALRPEVTGRMRDRLADYDRQPISTAVVREMDPELQERLRALGYLD